MLKRRLDGKTIGVLIVLLMSLCVSAFARSRSDEWKLNPSDYRYDMSLYLSLASKDYENLDLYEIGAFVNDECRGVAEKLELPDGGSCLYMRVRSNVSSGETVTFKLRDRESGSTYELAGDGGAPLTFKADEMVGRPSAPYILRIYFNVAVSTDGHGTVDFENGAYPDGHTLSLTATPYEGYHFDKWSDGVTTAARELTVDGDIDLVALFAPNIYNAVFVAGGEVIATYEVAYGEAVPTPETPVKDGFLFTGWNDIPVTMPAHDIEIHGDFIANSYNAVFMIDGEIIAALNLPYGAEIVPPAVPEKTGYTFAGWDNLPEVMPAGNIEVTGSYTVNSYTLTFSIDGEKIQESSVEYGSAITAPEAPEKAGYTFGGWQEMPATMPAYDLEIKGEYVPVLYNAVFVIDGEIIATEQVQAGMPVNAPEAPAKEGHTFAGWQNLPEVMPAQDIEITGVYDINTYIATFTIGTEVVARIPVVYNTAVTAPEAPAKEGHTFTGWQNIPETMPPFDITIEGNYAVNSYNAVFMIDDVVVATISTEYGAPVAAPEAPVKEGYTFGGWQDVPATMPAGDITINGSYSILSYLARFIIDGNVVSELTVEYGAPVTAPEAPEKEGYLFTGWQNVPDTMPASDVDIVGAYEVIAYNVVFKIGDEVVAYIPVDFGAPVPTPEAPVKEGHTFTGWQDVPDTMPAHDIEITGGYSINTYKAVFIADGETVATLDVEYGAAVTAPEAPAKEGYTFTGWQNVPATMPASDIEVLGTYSVNAYTATFRIGDEVVATVPVDFGAAVPAPEAPVKEGYSFTGWQNVPETMPAQDIEINGAYSINTYKAVFIADGETVATLDVEYNSAVTAPEAPAKEGYTFTGWQNVPETMPAFDIEVLGTYSVNTYTATFKIDNEVVAVLSLEYGARISAPEAPAKEGFLFDGWSNVPATMPAQDIEITGTYSEDPNAAPVISTYTATFRIDGEVIAMIPVEEGAVIPAPEAPTKEGHTFTGWQNLPEVMPSHDIEITGAYTVNSYKATFVIDGVVIEEKTVEYNTAVSTPEAPAKEGYTFTGWQNVPETMPPFDIEIQGSYTVVAYTATFKIGDEVIAALQFDYGSPVVAPAVPEKEGHTFAGWQNVPETMPASDIEISGAYAVNSYKATFVIDGVVIGEKTVEYNTAVSTPEAPEKEGHAFTGWQNVPETMPPFDIEIHGSYTVLSYTATFRIGDDVIAAAQFDYGTPVPTPAVPEKEGHTFAGWENVPETMPAQDIEIIGSYTVNVYKATFNIDGEIIAEKDVEYNTVIETPEVPEKAGHSFSGWLNLPQTMPPFDIEILGSFAANSYNVTFVIDGEVFATVPSVYGTEIAVPEVPAKEGHTFAGWQNLPETTPAEDIVVNGSYTVNTYKATFMADDVVVAETDVEYNTIVPVPDAPEKEGHTFTGWQNVPETMPPFDVTILGTYAVNTYLVTFTVDGEVVAELPCDYGTAISTPEAPAKEGHTFAGWNDVPATMPAGNIVITGSYTVNSYVARYLIGDEVIAEQTVEYGAILPPVTAPEREGESFAGWDNLPEVMPAHNVDICGSYVKNTYTVTFMIGDELVAALRVNYGDAIQQPEAPAKEGHEFTGWENVPETMPAQDIVINGAYKVCSYMLTVYLNDDIYISESVEYGAPVVIPEPEVAAGYEFTGWLDEIPETMPAHDVEIHGEVKQIQVGIEDLYADGDGIVTVYNLNGVLLFRQISVSDAMKRLAPGYYIVNGSKVRVK